MLLQLQEYDSKFVYKKETKLYVTDTLSPSYIDDKSDPDVDKQVDILFLISISPARMAKLQKHTLADPVMQKVTHFISNGWPAKSKSVPQEAYELIVDDGVILKGLRVVVPQTLCKEYLGATPQGASWNRRYKEESKRNRVLAFFDARYRF